MSKKQKFLLQDDEKNTHYLYYIYLFCLLKKYAPSPIQYMDKRLKLNKNRVSLNKTSSIKKKKKILVIFTYIQLDTKYSDIRVKQEGIICDEPTS